MTTSMSMRSSAVFTDAEGLPSADDSLVERVDHVEHLAFAERHMTAGRLLVVEVRPEQSNNTTSKLRWERRKLSQRNNTENYSILQSAQMRSIKHGKKKYDPLVRNCLAFVKTGRANKRAS